MARWSPPPPLRDGEHFSIGHDAVSLYFFVACVAATVALTSSMCSACGRKPKAVSQEPDDAAKASVHGETPGGDGGEAHEDEEVVTLSPELATHGPIQPQPLPVSASRRKLSISMSLSKAQSKAQNLVNIPDKMRLSKRERRDKDGGGGEDGALWKKAIILGEKCRIPGERGDGEGPSGSGGGDPSDSADDEMAAGTFRRSSYSRPVSRSNSFAVQQPTVAEAPAVLQPPPYS